MKPEYIPVFLLGAWCGAFLVLACWTYDSRRYWTWRRSWSRAGLHNHIKEALGPRYIWAFETEPVKRTINAFCDYLTRK